MEFGVLGPLEVRDDAGALVDLGGRQPRTLLAMLLAASGRAVSVDAIVDCIWGDDPPQSATGTLHSYVSRLRRRLGTAAPLVHDDAGYRLEVPFERIDARRFQTLADEGRSLLAAGRVAEASAVLREADELWRGPAFAEFLGADFAVGPATRLEERRLAALDDRVDADLALGRHAALVGELTELVGAQPLREALRMRLALALYRSGRQAEALRALADAARTLREELGIEPSRPLRELESAILAQDPSLDVAPPPTVASSGSAEAAAGAGSAERATAIASVGEAAGAGGASAAAGSAAPRVSPSGTGGRGGGGALLGRDAELGQLLAALDESRTDARFVVVEGEPGIGKTRLADELRRRGDELGAIAIWGRSDESGAAPALWPWLPPLRALAQRAGTVAPALEELIGGSTPIVPGRAVELQFERFEAVADLLARAAAGSPVVVLLDDLQWADEASAELLAFLAQRLERGVLVVATMRTLEVGRHDAVTDALAAIARRAGSRRLHLRGLSEEATAAVLDATVADGNASAVAASIHERSEGNPFFAIELARLFVEEGDARGAVPASVRDVVRRRVARLPESTVDLLGVAAVIGRDVEINLLVRAAERPFDECLDALEPAIVHRLLVEVPELPSVYRFSHALVREVLLDDISSLRRARLHLRIADAIESVGAGIDDAEILAEHLWRAAPVGVGLRAARALRRAADVALRRVAYGAAEDLLTKAVQLQRTAASADDELDEELDTIVLLLEVARARRYYQGIGNRELLERAKQLATRLGRRDVLLGVLWFEWSALATSCRGTEAEPLAREFFELMKNEPELEMQAVGHGVWAVRCWGAGRIKEAVQHLDIAIEMFEQVPEQFGGLMGERRLVNHTFWLWMHLVTGDMSVDDVFRGFDRLVARMPERFAISSVCGFAATAAIVAGAWDHLDRYVQLGFETDPGSQFSFWYGQHLMQRSIVLARQGRVDEALESFAAGHERYTGVDGRSALPAFQATLAMQIAAHGRVEDARRQVDGARLELDTYDERWNEPIVLLAEGVVTHAEGDAEAARRLVERAAEVANEQGSYEIAARARSVLETLG
jgi:DNA-binding SARP family transcriptional activator